MDTKKQKQIQCLQNNLSSIRRICGWTAEELRERIGVTKQTISNLENNRTPMTLTQYIAIRSIIDYEVAINQENIILPRIVFLLLDNYEQMDDATYSKVQEVTAAISVSAASGTDTDTLLAMLNGALSRIDGIAVAEVGVGASFLGAATGAGLLANRAFFWLDRLTRNMTKKCKKRNLHQTKK